MPNFIMSAAPTEAMPEATSTDSLGSGASGADMDTSVRRRHMVKPMAPSKETANRDRLFIPSGRLATPNFSASQVKPKMPMGFPMSRPPAIPSAGMAALDATVPKAWPTGTAVLARANTGMIRKVASGESLPTRRWAKASPLYMARVEMHRPTTTPAMSAETPAFMSAHQRATPPTAKILASALRLELACQLPTKARAAVSAPATPRKAAETCLA
mmetsp:Transcript_4075/g.13660  ORF Transcript_4075/g.13660 Transcript_4075/m.13660 type:complete len:215 (-) Transcript_4075:730-1374(-)